LSVLEKARELCIAIKESPEFKNYQEAKEKVLNNPEDKDRLERYLELMNKASQAEKENRSLTMEEKYNLERISKAVAFYPETGRFLAVQKQFFDLFQQVSTMLQATAQNREIPDCSSKKSGKCTGSCEDCG